MFYWTIKYLLAIPILRAMFRPQVTGVKNIPRKGGVIIASNHLSFIDSAILPLMVRRRVYFLAASTYYSNKSFGAWALKRLLLATGMIPLDRSGGKASEASLQAGLKVLREGRMLGIYPEGSRSRDGKMHRGRTGVARLVLEAQVPVVPVAMIDTEKVIPVGSTSNVPHLQQVRLVFGAPLDFSRYVGQQTDHATLRVITDQIMTAIRELSGQEYVDAYTSSRGDD